MDDLNDVYGNIRQMCVVVDGEGKPVACAASPLDGAAFARCLGFDAPLEAMVMVPVIEFARDGARS